MSNAVVDSTGGELTLFVTRGSDLVFGVEARDDADELRNITTLLLWLEGADSGFTATMVAPGSFTLVLPRAVTSALESVTAYSIGCINELSMHEPLLNGFVRVTRGRLGTGT